MFMYRVRQKSGFSLIEVLTAVAIIAILAGALLGLGKHLRTQAEINLTLGTMGVLESALDQYYDAFGQFPFETNLAVDEVFDMADFETVLGETITFEPGSDYPDDAEWSNIAMVYFLRNHTNSRRLLDAVSDTLVTNVNDDGEPTQFVVGTDEPVELLRIRDAWGNDILYRYDTGDAYPLLVSPGPDGLYTTAGDNVRND